MKKSILFVCTGNTCRSPMAACYFQHLVKGRDIRVESAGTHAQNGLPASPLAIRIMERFQLDLRRHISWRMTEEMVDAFDMIIVMTENHRQNILSLRPDAGKKIYLLREFSETKSLETDIHDPMGGNEDEYQETFNMMKDPLERLATIL